MLDSVNYLVIGTMFIDLEAVKIVCEAECVEREAHLSGMFGYELELYSCDLIK